MYSVYKGQCICKTNHLLATSQVYMINKHHKSREQRWDRKYLKCAKIQNVNDINMAICMGIKVE